MTDLKSTRPAMTAAGPAPACNAMTVDVEDYFQVSAFEGHIDRGDWDGLKPRVEVNTDRILGLFADHDVRATFFMLGWVAERFPDLVRRIVAAGHEIASHGYSHVRITGQSQGDFRADIAKTRRLLEDISGAPVLGYRAASYSITKETLWALDALAEAGYRYSSSIYPIRHDLYGIPDAPRFPFYPDQRSGLIEVPVTTVMLFGRRFPCGGGGYFRLFPYAVSKFAIERVRRRDGMPCVFYFHPWEIDPEQPRQQGISARTRFRHYLNLDRVERRLRRLMTDFRWDRMDRVFLPAAAD